MPIIPSKGQIRVDSLQFEFHDMYIAIQPACLHNELNMTHNMRGERVYWCSDCARKIVIPISTLATIKQSELAGIIGMAFGQRWKEQAEKGLV